MQHDGKAFRAKHAEYRKTGVCSELRLDIADAYPAEAGILAWQRTFRLIREQESVIEISDEFTLNEPTDELYLSLMSVCEPVHAAPGSFILEYAPGKQVVVFYDAEQMALISEKIELTERRLHFYWGSAVYRILLKVKVPVLQGKTKIQVRQLPDFEA
jgi:hypothetical protein